MVSRDHVRMGMRDQHVLGRMVRVLRVGRHHMRQWLLSMLRHGLVRVRHVLLLLLVLLMLLYVLRLVVLYVLQVHVHLPSVQLVCVDGLRMHRMGRATAAGR